MKKFLAFTLSLVMSASFLTACGDEDSSSKKSKDSSSTSSSAAADSSTADSADSKADSDAGSDDSSTADASSDDASSDNGASTGDVGPLTKAYTEKMAAGVFSMEMKANVMSMDTNITIKQNGENMFMALDLFGEQMEIYKVDGKAIVLLPSEKKYGEVPEDQLAQYTSSVNTYALADNAKYVGTTEEDGMTVETFKVPLDIELGEGVTLESTEEGSNETETKYYYDADGNLKKIVTNAPMVGETTVEVVSLSFDNVTIELPDLSGYEKVEQTEEESSEESVAQ